MNNGVDQNHFQDTSAYIPSMNSSRSPEHGAPQEGGEKENKEKNQVLLWTKKLLQSVEESVRKMNVSTHPQSLPE